MRFDGLVVVVLSIGTLFLSACGGGGLEGRDDSSRQPASPEPAYYGKPTYVADPVVVSIPTKFLYRPLNFVPGALTGNGLTAVSAAVDGLGIAFAEFHIYDSAGVRIQQGETDTSGIAEFNMPKVEGSYTLKVFSRAQNNYLNISVLEDIYNNTPHYASSSFTLTSTDIINGTKDLSASPVIADADESRTSRLEGGAFNIMYNILLANEFIRAYIGKDDDTAFTDPNKWWVADKVTVYWKAGFNPYSYYGSPNSPLSFYSPGERKLYILGGVNGDVKNADTDHFDDSVILHEYAHFLEDVYGNSASPGGSHNGNFVIDARLAWSEGWANYFQAAVLSGTTTGTQDTLPTGNNTKYRYYVDTRGYLTIAEAATKNKVNISFDLWTKADGATYDSVTTDLPGGGAFREVSISRSLYKSTRATSSPEYDTSKSGAGINFSSIWATFAGEDTNNHRKASNPLSTSLVNTSLYPLPSMGLFNYLLNQNIAANTAWDTILAEEKQKKSTEDYAYYLGRTAGCTNTTFTLGKVEASLGDIYRSDQLVNNDFYIFAHDGSNTTLSLQYNGPLNLDLILYKKDYVYFEDQYWYGGYSSSYIVRQSRSPSSTTESINLSGVPAGTYVVNVKVNTYGKTQNQLGATHYQLLKGGTQICGTER